jgi:actin-related protein
MRIMAGAVEGDVFIGRRAQELRGLLKIRYPIEHGIVNDWEDMERIWQYIYTDELKTLSEEVSATIWSSRNLSSVSTNILLATVAPCPSY